jgi:glycosyltransferase involved in cell wall biosynthesis
MTERTLVAVEARLLSPEAVGGISQVIMSLAESLSSLRDGCEDYIFVCWEGSQDWLGRYVSDPCRLHLVPRAAWKDRLADSAIGPALLKLRQMQRSLVSSLTSRSLASTALAQSDGTVEAIGADIVHFPMQAAYLTDLPSIYHPHDLQHIHMPELFDASTIRWRETAYRMFCARAHYVAVESAWMKRDVVEQIGVAPEAVAVCPMLPPTLADPDVGTAAEVRKSIGFEHFIFYPAQTWPHKNHVRLIDALSSLQARHGLTVPLVCTGRKTEYFEQIAARIQSCGLENDIRFLGFVSEGQLSTLYRIATAVVVPTLFESLSLPVWEAFAAGTPVACSRVTALPEQIADAGLLFDPLSVDDMASAIKKLWESEALRTDLVRKGERRLKQFSSVRMSRHIRALYRQALGRGVTEEDRALLAAPPLI